MNRPRTNILVVVGSVLLIIYFFYHYQNLSQNSSLDGAQYQSSIFRPAEEQSRPKPIWLVATSTPVQALQRREIIRSTWQTLYQNQTLFTARFVIAKPDLLWTNIIRRENTTYGDIVVLDNLEETPHIANTIKSIEMLKHFTTQGIEFDFVSKLDDDSYIEPNAFYHKYLIPILSSGLPSQRRSTIIGRELHQGSLRYPGGQFYTITWPLARKLSQLHMENAIMDEHEDVLIGRLLSEANESWDLVVLPNSVAFDYSDDQGRTIDGLKTAWATNDADLNAWVHAVGPGAINPHKMRKDEEYLRVAACYDANGLKQPDL